MPRHSFVRTVKLPDVNGRIDYISSQDGIVISARGIALTHTAGHGNCPKVLIEYDYE